jgi:hypothetical protein
MLEYDSRSLASGAGGLALVLLLTFPSVFAIASHFRETKPKSQIYEDKDGIASEESMAAYSAKAPKIILSLFTLAGFLTSIPLAVFGTLNRDYDSMFIENWLIAAHWVSTRDGRIIVIMLMLPVLHPHSDRRH